MSEKESLESALPDVLRSLSQPEVKVTDESGQERISPTIPMAVVALAQLGQIVKIRKALERRQFKGVPFNSTINCTPQDQVIELLKTSPYEPLATVSFYNAGPGIALIDINEQQQPFPLSRGDNASIDFTEGDRRIEVIRYYSAAGTTATVRLMAKY